MIDNNYKINLENFQGPMDLLLYFIKRDRIDIYDIPISKIANDYLEYISMMEMLDIDIGAEFIYMSTVLLQIKARMLLPKVMGEDGEEIEDPRVDLVHRILDYKRFKNASKDLDSQYDSHKKKFSKGMNMKYDPSQDISLYVSEDVKLFDLARTFKNILEALPENNELDLEADQKRVKDQNVATAKARATVKREATIRHDDGVDANSISAMKSKKTRSVSPFSYVAMINKTLSRVIRKNMRPPALQNQTGGFANSVRVQDVNTTREGYLSFGYTYQKDPYQVFEVGKGVEPWSTSQRDPRKLIDKSIREVAAELALGRFYTRRV